MACIIPDRKILKPEKDQFGIIGIQIAGNMMHLNVLVRDKTNINRYYHIQSAEIPVQVSDPNIVTNFIEILHNILITNITLLYHGTAELKQIMEKSEAKNIHLKPELKKNKSHDFEKIKSKKITTNYPEQLQIFLLTKYMMASVSTKIENSNDT
ncbi:hypothetical protein C2G38_2204039 [Gigaspora rosea]|uniref:Uncharacterized protein n=1 Tax=Gigaspora rosea TaxID=44941 RepID=A0A397UPK9_9GLOM|nr:hypothetical protein C2G38_2204039 [Gigaspora rosea]